VPLSIGAVYRSRGGVEELLRRSAPLFEQLLNRFHDREEWGFKALGNRANLEKSAAAESARLRDLDRQVETSSPGKGFFLRKQQARVRDEEASSFLQRSMTEAYETLSAVSTEATIDDIGETASAEDLRLLFKAAFLVDRPVVDRFIRAAEGLHERLARIGIDIEISGPWAPYSFAKGGDHAGVIAR
jgi:hypothetical protein